MLGISQFYILSPRGDTIISRDYRSDIVKGSASAEIFFRKVKFWDAEKNDKHSVAPPVFLVDGINFLHLRTNGLYFVFTTKFNVSPNTLLELLSRISQLCKDYCGILSEEAIRKNFILIYELLDEAIDYGYPQNTDTLYLKQFVRNEPVVIETMKTVRKITTSSANLGLKLPTFAAGAQSTTTPSTSVHKPVTMSDKEGDKHRNEIFVDVIERLKLTFNSHGYVVSSNIDGCIQLKSYLSGNPALKLALNDDLVIGKHQSGLGVTLDDCNFHECVQLNEFDQTRTISFVPPDGEFILMNYRITADFVPPFKVFPFVEELSSNVVEVVLRVRADIPQANFASSVVVLLPIARATNGVSLKLESGTADNTQTAEYKIKENQVVWTIKKFKGCAEHTLRAKITFKDDGMIQSIKRELGPVSLAFEIPMYNVSNLQVKYLRIAEQSKSYNPYRWVRYLTNSASYVCRI